MRRSPPILLTRPNGQEVKLKEALQSHGFEVSHLPLIDIQPLPESSQIKQRLLNIDHYQGVIAISANAARLGCEWMDTYWPQWPIGIEWFAIGTATADRFAQAGIHAHVPPQHMDSEGLLAHPKLAPHVVQGNRYLIWRGVGGRETLASVLLSRGANVDYAELYRREEHRYSQQQWHDALARKPVLVVSSGQALAWMRQHVPDLSSRVHALVLPSQRVADTLNAQTENAFTRVWVAKSARDNDMIDCMTDNLNNNEQP